MNNTKTPTQRAPRQGQFVKASKAKAASCSGRCMAGNCMSVGKS